LKTSLRGLLQDFKVKDQGFGLAQTARSESGSGYTLARRILVMFVREVCL